VEIGYRSKSRGNPIRMLEAEGERKQITYLSLCPKLKSVLRYAACAVTNKAEARGELKKRIVAIQLANQASIRPGTCSYSNPAANMKFVWSQKTAWQSERI
jgi:hypothetical protein